LTKKSASKNVIKDIIIVVAGVLAIWFGLSMIPELEVFDVLVVQGNDPFEEIEIGDIIVFDRPAGHDRVIVHRVVSIIEEDPLTIRTKGDANPASIPGTDFPITQEEYIGQVVYVIPQVGYITKILQPPINYIIIAVIVGIMIYKQVSKKKEEVSSIFDEKKSSDDIVDEPKTFSDDEINKLPDDKEYSKSDNPNYSTDKKEVTFGDEASDNENDSENKK